MITVYILKQRGLLKDNYYYWGIPPKAYSELHIICTHNFDNDIILIPKNVECPVYLQNIIDEHLLYKGYTIAYLYYNNPYNPSFPNLTITSRDFLLDLSYISRRGEYEYDLFKCIDMSIIDEFFSLPESVIREIIKKKRKLKDKDYMRYWNYSLTIEENLNI